MGLFFGSEKSKTFRPQSGFRPKLDFQNSSLCNKLLTEEQYVCRDDHLQTSSSMCTHTSKCWMKFFSTPVKRP